MLLTDFHMHTILSDGALIPSELVSRMVEKGFDAIAITDHVDSSSIDRVIKEIAKIKEDFEEEIAFLPGVEITYVPPRKIPELAKKAKREGLLVVVHGETIAETVKKGTNLAAVMCPDVDILAHPGVITEEEVKIAAENEVFLELSGRKGHCLTNGLVAKLGMKYKAKMLVNSDAHAPPDFLTKKRIEQIIIGSGLDEEKILKIMNQNPRELLKRLGQSI
ncbi:MAG: histidinol phosphate phosphatase domain-containing protein [Candidatus Heimdallarchaeaceae archaeon]